METKKCDIQKGNTIFYMDDMQNDFVNPKGKLYVPKAEALIPIIQKLQKYAQDNGIREYASADRHFFSDPEISDTPNWSTTFPPHCMDGTIGQGLVFDLGMEHAAYIAHKLDEFGTFHGYTYDNMLIALSSRRQVVFEKQSTDVTANPHFETAINYLKSEGIKNAVVYGVATEYCIKDAVNGFLKNGLDVILVTDAITGIDMSKSKKVIDDFISRPDKKVTVATSDEILRALQENNLSGI
jgi:nicotinamidase/pyrazinamidase